MNTVLSTAYFPNILYINKLATSPNVVIDIHEHYVKQTYRNRCHILTANGVLPLSVPVKMHFHCVVKDLRIDYSERWQTRHFRAIMSAYKNSPYYDHYIGDLQPLFMQRHTFLVDLNAAILDIIGRLLRLDLSYSYSDSYVDCSDDSLDFRTALQPKSESAAAAFASQRYIQVFASRYGFVPNLSIADLLFNEGPNSVNIVCGG